jgi:hypothetical protein
MAKVTAGQLAGIYDATAEGAGGAVSSTAVAVTPRTAAPRSAADRNDSGPSACGRPVNARIGLVRVGLETYRNSLGLRRDRFR